LPHSDIPGSQPAGGSPGLIAAIHVLHRLSVPRHPPCALASSASRSLDSTKPAGSIFSTFRFACSTTLRLFRCGTGDKNRPDIRRALDQARQEVVDPRYAIENLEKRMMRSFLSRLCWPRHSDAVTGPKSNIPTHHSDVQPAGVEPRGFEPLTSAVQRRRSPN
jgi:hypothetical protein